MISRLPLIFLAICLVVALVIWLLPATGGFDKIALWVADGIMLALSLGALALMRPKLNERPQAFVRGVFSATLLRMFVCMAAIMIYALAKRPDLHRGTLYALFGIYALYTLVETSALSRKVRKQ
ncbi:MAG: hypothetical protein JST06_04480 [Bacteroidetes bacterium]|nr:hypothetical protein [Bacteroidota bacterium]MBS1628880.1 hypothetical protein [Bacteroidota bacterium]